MNSNPEKSLPDSLAAWLSAPDSNSKERNGVLIVGSGGHARVVADILRCQRVPIKGFVDDDPDLWHTEILGLPILGSPDDYERFSPTGLVLGVGSNSDRRHIVERLGERAQHLWLNAIHPSAIIAESVRLGVGTVICAGAIITPGSVIGDYVIINTGAAVDHDNLIKNYAHICPGAHLAGSVSIGEGVLIGTGASIIPNVSVGDWATVGAGAVVTKDIPGNVIAKGIPARWVLTLVELTGCAWVKKWLSES